VTGDSRNDALQEAAWAFVFSVAFPKLAHQLGWHTRNGLSGALLFIALRVAFNLAVQVWAVPFFRRVGEQGEREKDELRRRLGREPSAEELGADRLARREAGA
jgi:hypothetical protein